MSLSKRIRTCLTVLMMGIGTSVASAEVVVVVSHQSVLGELSHNQVADIFLGKTSRLPDGGRVVPIDLAEGSRVRDEFYMKLSGKSPAQVKAHWSRIVFTGKGQPPKEMPNSNALKKIIADDPRFIGYMDRSAVDASVKTVVLIQ